MKFLIRDNNNYTIIDTLSKECHICLQNCTSEGKMIECPIKKDERRCGIINSRHGALFLCGNKNFAKTTYLFKEKFNILVNTVPSIIRLKEDVFLETQRIEQERYEKIVHNLRTLNGQSIQEQYTLISQDILAENYNNQIELVSNTIEKDPKKAALVFLRLIKNNSSIKTEFITHEKLSVEAPRLSVNRHDIRKVILNVYHHFFLELQQKNIHFQIFDEKTFLYLDYETIRLALYHIFHNTSKYIKPNSTLRIILEEEDIFIKVLFQMVSIHISENDLIHLFEDGYSGDRTQSKNKQGKGLGMGLIKKALELNNAEITIKPGKQFINKDYSSNEFIFTFMKKI